MALPNVPTSSLTGNEFGFFVPPGREVKIYLDKTSIFAGTEFANAVLMYDDDLQLNIKSKYGSLVENAGNNFMTLLSGVSIGGIQISGQFALQGLQIWQETDPLTFSLSVALHTNTDPLNDVIKPALHLASLIVPSTTGENGKESWNLIPPGPNIAALLEQLGDGAASVSADLQNKKVLAKSKGVFNVEIGNYLSIPQVIITGVEPVFSKTLVEVEGSGKLVPVSCKMGLEMTTASIATKEMLQGLFSSAL